MWVKYVNNKIEKWPYDLEAIRADNPTVGIPDFDPYQKTHNVAKEIVDYLKEHDPDFVMPTTIDLSHLNAYVVSVSEAPSHNSMVQIPVLTTPVLKDGEWTADYTIENKSQEDAEAAVRAHRDTLIAETDVWAMVDRTMTQAQKDYRQALRDVPSQSGFPFSVVWPTKP